MSDPVPSTNLGPQKRRSTRIVHAVPLTVTGVDALGQPFKERTSTLIISCHGCKYQSKHYVPKNSYIRLEIPNPDSSEPPRTSQARVTWVQRPRTVRELFQVGVELEVPGNIWGVSFPPDDWFPYVEPGAVEIPSPGEAAAETSIPQAAVEEPAPPSIPAPVFAAEEKARVVAFPVANEISAMMARQMARLLVEAKQQIQKSVRDATATTAAEEVARVADQLLTQLQEAAGKAVASATAEQATQVSQLIRSELDAARQQATEALRQEWAREAERSIRNWNQHLALQLTETAQALRDKLISQTEAQINAAGAATGEAWQRQLAADMEKPRASLAELSQSARQLGEQIAATAQQARQGWRNQAEADLAAASLQWQDKLKSSLAAATEQLAGQLSQLGQNVTAAAGRDLAARLASLRQAAEKLLAESQQRVAGLSSGLDPGLEQARAALAELNRSIERSANSMERLETASKSVRDDVNRHFEELLEAQREEMHRRADEFIGGIAGRLQPMLEAGSNQALQAFQGQLDQVWKPLLGRAEESAERLRAARQQVDETLRSLQEQLSRKSEQIFAEVCERMQGRAGQLRKDFEAAGQVALGRFQEELEAKSTEATHNAFEALFKSSEWYQKKAQTSMQAMMEKAFEQSSNSLREKAAEVSRVFASELDHYSRSYVDHTRGQLEEALKDAAERGRGILIQASQTTAASFTDDVHRISAKSLEDFSGATRKALEEAAGQLAARAKQVRAALNADSHQAFAEFEGRVAERVDQGVAQARQRVDAQMTTLLEAWRARIEAQQKDWLEHLSHVTGDAVEQYKGRLENASNSWLVASVTTLSQHSQTVIEALAQAAESRLRQTCSQVFAGLGESLRARLLGLSSEVGGDPPPGEKK